MITTSIVIKGDVIASQVIRYQISSQKELAKEEIEKLQKMKESEFKRYAENHSIEYIRK